jgi:Lon protease-like protein
MESGVFLEPAHLPDDYTLFSHAYGPIRVPEFAPLVVLRDAVAFPDSLTLPHIARADNARAIKAVGEEQFSAVCLLTSRTSTTPLEARGTAALGPRDLNRIIARRAAPDDLAEFAQACVAAGRFMEARVVCEQALRDNPKSPELHLLLARIHAEEGNGTRALALAAQGRELAVAAGRNVKLNLVNSAWAAPLVPDGRLPDIGCVARVRAVRQESKGTFGALVEVGPRVRVRDVESQGELRICQLEAFPETPPTRTVTDAELERLRQAALFTLRADLDSATLAHSFLSRVTSPLVLAGLCVPSLGLSVIGQEQLLEADGDERLVRVMGMLVDGQ